MSSTFTIQLHNLRFFAAHGLYVEEAAAGNEFEVNVSLQVKAPKTNSVTLGDTVNYAGVYQIVKDEMAGRQDLLETIAIGIAKRLKKQFPTLRKVSIQISKLHPPITSFTGSVSVTYHTKFKH